MEAFISSIPSLLEAKTTCQEACVACVFVKLLSLADVRLSVSSSSVVDGWKRVVYWTHGLNVVSKRGLAERKGGHVVMVGQVLFVEEAIVAHLVCRLAIVNLILLIVFL